MSWRRISEHEGNPKGMMISAVSLQVISFDIPLSPGSEDDAWMT
jgi:hypothetical protein